MDIVLYNDPFVLAAYDFCDPPSKTHAKRLAREAIRPAPGYKVLIASLRNKEIGAA